MNQTTSAATAATAASIDTQERQSFALEMRGFTDAEKSMLISTFRLTSRRSMYYVESSGQDQRPDIYLINADKVDVLKSLKEDAFDSPNIYSPAVLIGRTPIDTQWSFLTKPIQWIRLFESLDAEVLKALEERKIRERLDATWDGQIYRRSIDKMASTLPVSPKTQLRESVLVVDDSATVRGFMRIKLAPFNFDVDYAETGEIAVEKANAKSYTCIFLDVMMPGIDGYEVCKRIKGNPATKNTAVVMLTSKSSMIDKLRGSWSGCDAYLSKPVAEHDLLATIAKFLPSSWDV